MTGSRGLRFRHLSCEALPMPCGAPPLRAAALRRASMAGRRTPSSSSRRPFGTPWLPSGRRSTKTPSRCRAPGATR
eukprot:15258055-Alexandrium_andersonii.AAC.1